MKGAAVTDSADRLFIIGLKSVRVTTKGTLFPSLRIFHISLAVVILVADLPEPLNSKSMNEEQVVVRSTVCSK